MIESSFEDLLKEQGTLEETYAIASKRLLAWQLAQALEVGQLSREDMAERMVTTVSEIDHILDPEDNSVQLDTLHRAAAAVGRKVKLELT